MGMLTKRDLPELVQEYFVQVHCKHQDTVILSWYYIIADFLLGILEFQKHLDVG